VLYAYSAGNSLVSDAGIPPAKPTPSGLQKTNGNGRDSVGRITAFTPNA